MGTHQRDQIKNNLLRIQRPQRRKTLQNQRKLIIRIRKRKKIKVEKFKRTKIKRAVAKMAPNLQKINRIHREKESKRSNSLMARARVRNLRKNTAPKKQAVAQKIVPLLLHQQRKPRNSQ